MNGIMNESVIVEEYEHIIQLIHKVDSIIDNCITDCSNKSFHTFDPLMCI